MTLEENCFGDSSSQTGCCFRCLYCQRSCLFAWSSLTRQTLNRGRFSHGHHSHGKPLTEVEQKAANGIFDDANVQNRTLSDWDGVWQSVYPLLQSGKLDPVFQKKADADKTKTFAEIKDYYHKGYATDIEMIGIEDGIVEFHRNNETTVITHTANP